MKTKLLLWACLAGLTVAAPAADPQKIGDVDVSTWRGFNLCEKFTLGKNGPFIEDDFKWIHEFGFNFVRLPTDYRCYSEKNDWLKFKEPQLKEIDQAIEFGEKYQIHVSLNLHRAPGFCINPPEEPTNLWKEEPPLNAFIAHWVMFAKRYKHISPARLSFNLLNEPTRCTKEEYLKVFCRTIEAIQKEDPNRIILVDGYQVGKEPSQEFLKYKNIVQATRGYHPSAISHYKANWVKGSDKWPEPTWPLLKVGGILYGPMKPDLRTPWVIKGDFKAGTEISLRIFELSQKDKLVVKADGKVIAEKVFDPKAKPAEWTKVPESKYNIMQPAAPMYFKVTLPKASEVSFENVEGDWFKASEVSIQVPGGARNTYATDMNYGHKPAPVQLSADGRLLPPPGVPIDAILKDYLRPWRDISAKGGTVFVGEWGAFSKTLHPVALAWMKSWLENWKEAHYGWALWNFRGSFGILDSNRQDVKYEDFNGHKLDREMLKLLQEYLRY